MVSAFVNFVMTQSEKVCFSKGALKNAGAGRKSAVSLGQCPSTVRPMFPKLVFQVSKQQNCAQSDSELCSDKEIPLKML